MTAQVEQALTPFIGAKAAKVLTRADIGRAVGTLAAFDKAKAKALRHALTENDRKFSGIGRAEAQVLADKVASHLASVQRLVDAGKVKVTLPEAFRVKALGDSYRFIVNENGKAVYAPIKRKPRKAK